jgi:hypothetical protein
MLLFRGCGPLYAWRLPWTLAASAARADTPNEVSDRDKSLSTVRHN